MSLPRLRGLALVALCAAQAALAPAPALAATTPAAHQAGAAATPTATVTLITGDKVTAAVTADGAVSPQVRDADGRLTGYLSHRQGKDTFVYPHDALPYVAAGLLDEDLFNITELVADGYDDAHSDQLPLIVTYTAASAAARSVAPKGAAGLRRLDSIGGAALSAGHSGAFWSSITNDRAVRATDRRVAFGSGIAKVWLDGKAKAALAESTAQIGAPAVWQTGDIGAGVDVAVLDTGVDTTHPDLAGQLAAAVSFVPDVSVEDGFGHGTHVASTIAGTGAASGGVEKGVAPGARLHIGKVLGDDGFGQDSWIISGMEWAARDQHAKIINMSLGADPTDGTDPMSLAVNELTAETGALFVVSAGNSGPSAYTVGSPGAADAALTVGAVDSADLLTFFSSQGPRLGDKALKPDLTAPGVDILAARSQHLTTGEGWYQTMSGTSMAAPHVTGAAALLAAEHPGLTAQQLKDALVSTTKPTPDVSAYAGGSGRLDVAAAAGTPVFASAGANFGYPDWPTAPEGEVGQEIRYTNVGADPVTLDLATDIPDAPAGMITLSARQVTVPAHGTASVTATTSFDRVPPDQLFSGFVTATSGAVHLHTSVAVGQEGVRHQLSLKVKDRDGRPIGGELVLLGKDITRTEQITSTGTLDLRLPEGTYSAWLSTDLEGAHGPSSRGLGLLPVPEISLDQDRTVVFDATKAHRATATTPQPATVSGSRFELIRDFGSGPWLSAWYPGAEYDSVWVLPTGRKVTQGTFTLGARWRLAQPTLTVDAYDDLRAQTAATPLPAGASKVDAVFAGDGSPGAYASVDARGKVAVVRRNDTVPLEAQAAAAASAGARLLLVVNDGTGRLAPWAGSIWVPVDPPPVTVATLTRDEGEQLIARIQHERRVRLDLTSHPVTAYVYDLTTDYAGAIPAGPTYRATPRNLARVDTSFRNWAPARALETRADTDPLGSASSLDYAETPAQGDRTDWVTAGEPWVTDVLIPGDQGQHTAPTAYRAGSAHQVHWFGPVQRPRLVADDITVFRQDSGHFFAQIPGWGDSGAAHEGSTYDNFGADNVVRLYQGDTLLSSTDRYNTLLVAGPLDPAKLPYRLVSENRRDAWNGGPYSSSTRTQWSFASAAVAAGTVESPALIQLDYAVDLDVAGKAGRRSDLTIAPVILPTASGGGAIRAVTLDVSYDDGTTWRRTTMRPGRSGWQTRLDAPRSAQFVTLRATARDSVGNSVDQVITRAFGLR